MKTFLQFFEAKVYPRIGMISLILALLALFSSLLMVYTKFSTTISYISHFFTFVDLKLMRVDFFDVRGGTFTGGDTYRGNGLNLAFNFLFVLASLVFIYTKKKVQHLLQFVFALILFSEALAIVLLFFFQFNQFTLANPISLLFLVRDIVIFLLSFGFLRLSDKKLQEELAAQSTEDKPQLSYINASKYKRFFHLLIDSFLFMILTFNAFMFLPRGFLNGMSSMIGERYTLTFLFFFSALAYYTFFEVLFQRTPAKYLTQTFVMGVKQTQLTFGTVFKRSLSRKIPFNSFSFLGERGWHDSISDTQVLSLNKNKVAYKYLLLLPAIALFFFLNYQFNEFRKDYVTAQTQKGMLQGELKALEQGLENIKPADMISLKRTSRYYNKASHFFRVLKVEGERLTLAKIEKTYKHKTLEDIYFFYESAPNTFETIQVDKDYIRKGICEDYKLFGGFEDCGYNYFENEEKLRVYSIDSPFEPAIHFDNRFRNSVDMETVRFESLGANCQLINVEVLEGEVEVNAYLPQKLNQINDDFKLRINFKEAYGSPYKLKMVVQSEIDPSLKYIYEYRSEDVFNVELVKVN